MLCCDWSILPHDGIWCWPSEDSGPDDTDILLVAPSSFCSVALIDVDLTILTRGYLVC